MRTRRRWHFVRWPVHSSIIFIWMSSIPTEIFHTVWQRHLPYSVTRIREKCMVLPVYVSLQLQRLTLFFARIRQRKNLQDVQSFATMWWRLWELTGMLRIVSQNGIQIIQRSILETRNTGTVHSSIFAMSWSKMILNLQKKKEKLHSTDQRLIFRQRMYMEKKIPWLRFSWTAQVQRNSECTTLMRMVRRFVHGSFTVHQWDVMREHLHGSSSIMQENSQHGSAQSRFVYFLFQKNILTMPTRWLQNLRKTE